MKTILAALIVSVLLLTLGATAQTIPLGYDVNQADLQNTANNILMNQAVNQQDALIANAGVGQTNDVNQLVYLSINDNDFRANPTTGGLPSEVLNQTAVASVSAGGMESDLSQQIADQIQDNIATSSSASQTSIQTLADTGKLDSADQETFQNVMDNNFNAVTTTQVASTAGNISGMSNTLEQFIGCTDIGAAETICPTDTTEGACASVFLLNTPFCGQEIVNNSADHSVFKQTGALSANVGNLLNDVDQNLLQHQMNNFATSSTFSQVAGETANVKNNMNDDVDQIKVQEINNNIASNAAISQSTNMLLNVPGTIGAISSTATDEAEGVGANTKNI